MENFVDNVENFLNTINADKKGNLKRNKAYRRHILTKKSAKTKRNLRKQPLVDSTNVKNMKKILPYL